MLNLEDRITREELKAFSDKLYDMSETKEFFDGYPRDNRADFFNDVKYYFGNHCGCYMWSYEYEV